MATVVEGDQTTFVGYLMPNPILYIREAYDKFPDFFRIGTFIESTHTFSIATTPRYRRGKTPFPGFFHFTLYTYLILLSVKQGGIRYHFKSLLYDVTWDWTQVSRTIGKHSTHQTNELVGQFKCQNSSISNNPILHEYDFVDTQLNVKTFNF